MGGRYILKHYLKKAAKMSPKEFVIKSKQFIWRRVKKKYLSIHDKYNSTYVFTEKNIVFTNYKNLNMCDVPQYSTEIANLHLRHYFDLLGSGWTHIGFGEQYDGCEGYCYNMQLNVTVDPQGEWLKHLVPTKCLSDAQAVWQCVSHDYQPIDWQIDFKSGYRWSAKKWYMDVEYGHLPGVDIKLPWELSRMQHLVQYVYAYMQAEDEEKEHYIREYRDEILDFIAQNPPRYGVCWRCTMDVGIRVANWLLAYDMFCSLGAHFDDKFVKIFSNAVYAHGIHIINNLEYSRELTSNHYLSDIGGLIFVAAHMASDPEIDAWLAFGMQELISEMEREFHEDGSNFEASTSYHCLSTEIMMYSACLCRNITVERRQNLKKYKKEYIKNAPYLQDYDRQKFNMDNEDIFPVQFWQRLVKALQFVKDISDTDGRIQQIGDMDSGRFLKLSPSFVKISGIDLRNKYLHLVRKTIFDKKMYFDEDMLNFSHLIQSLHNFQSCCNVDNSINGMIIHQRRKLPYVNLCKESSNSHDLVRIKEDILCKLPNDYTSISYDFSSDGTLLDGLQIIKYPGMGIYIFASNKMKLIVRCGEVGQNGNGGHCHNDQLSVCLNIDGKQIIKDAGSYLYTAAPDKRNEFRSTYAHFTPQVVGMEQNLWDEGLQGLFSLKEDRTKAVVLYIGMDGIIMVHYGFGKPVYRIIQLNNDKVSIVDYGVELVKCNRSKIFSNGYGKLLRY